MSVTDIYRKKWFKMLANGLLIWGAMMIFLVFLVMHRSAETYLVTEDIKSIRIDLNSPFLEGGMILTFGLICMMISKIFKSNLLVIVFGMLTLIIYYFKMSWMGM